MENSITEEDENRKSDELIKHLASFPQLNPNPVIEVDISGNVVFINPGAVRILDGLGLDKKDAAIFLPLELGVILDDLNRKSECSFSLEVVVKDRIFHETIQLIPQFNVARIYAFDITERKRAEEALRESGLRERERAEELATVLEAVPTPVIIVHDPDSTHMTGNRAADDLLKQPHGAEVSLSAPSKVRPRHFRALKDGRELRLEELPAQRAARGEHVQDFEFSLVFDDGTIRHLLGYGTPLLDDRGFPRGAVHVLIDITDRKKSEAALARSKSEFEAMFNSITDAVVFADMQRRVLMVNPAVERLFGYSPDEIIGRSAEIFYPDGDTYERIGREVYLNQTNVDSMPFEVRYRRRDGSLFYAETLGTKVKDVQGNIIGFIGIHRDITERKQAAEELQRAHDELEERIRMRTSELAALNDDLEAEIYERRKAERRLARINALYSVLSRVNEAIVRIHDPERLFEQTCRIIIDSKLFKMAWIGLLDPQTSKVEPIASAGDSGKYLDRITIIAMDVPEGRGPTGRAIVEGKVMVCPDIENDPTMQPWRESAMKAGFRSSAAFPLHAGSAVVGALTAYAETPHFFTDEELNLLSSLADDISFAIEAMAAEKKRIEAESSLLASSAEIKDLYNNAPCGYHSLDKEGRIVSINDTELSWLGYERDEVIGRKIDEFHARESRKRFKQLFPKFLKSGSIREVEFELIRKDGTLLPILLNATAMRDRDNNFIMTRSTVFDITERKAQERQTEAANNVLKLLSATASRSEYLNALVSQLKSWCGCSSVGIRIVGGEGDVPFAAHSGFSNKFLKQEDCLSLGKDSCACIRVIDEKPRRVETGFMTGEGSFVCNDTSSLCSKNLRDFYRHACIREGFSSLAVVPVRYRTEVIGALHLADPQKDAFPLQIIDFIETITPLVGEAVHRFSIEEELTASREQLRAFSAHLQEAREEERTKIAREIHDELGQILTAAGMELSILKNRYNDQAPIKKAALSVIGLLDNAVADIQRICEELRPRVLDHLGLPVAIKQEAAAFIKRTGIPCSLDLVSKIPGLTDESAVALFRIFQEALTNVARHSGAKAVSIRLIADKKNIILEITDNGKGISSQEFGKSTSLGLIGMRERVREISGEVTIQGTAGKGTVVTVRIPSGKRSEKR
ncbi:MAG: PAS domain S-box protein [Nitrospirae bacterium]|nr:PAS domain S-box protein [Nitrospirota bacterium]